MSAFVYKVVSKNDQIKFTVTISNFHISLCLGKFDSHWICVWVKFHFDVLYRIRMMLSSVSMCLSEESFKITEFLIDVQITAILLLFISSIDLNLRKVTMTCVTCIKYLFLLARSWKSEFVFPSFSYYGLQNLIAGYIIWNPLLIKNIK